MEDKANKAKICIVTLIGLPGSGKTSLCESLKYCINSFACLETDVIKHVIHICYDKLIPVEAARWQDGTPCWKEARRNVLHHVEQIVRCLKGLDEPKNDIIEDMLIDVANCSKPGKIFIIIDDNMYYRSMRYEYYQLARSYTLGFCQIYKECGSSQAIIRNAERVTQIVIPDEVIIRMSERLEPPDTCNPWEARSVTDTVDKSLSISDIECFLEDALCNPVVASEDDLVMRAASKAICAANVVHKVDLTLRKLVGEKIEQYRKAGLMLQELQKHIKSLADVRHLIMEGIKNGSIQVPEDIQRGVQECEPDSGDRLKHFLSSLLIY